MKVFIYILCRRNCFKPKELGLPFKKSLRLYIFLKNLCAMQVFFKYNKFFVQNEKKNTETRAEHVVKGRELV